MEEYRNMKHFCERCNYRTEFLKDFKKHMRTKKHLANTNSDTKLPFVCECGKQYKHSSSFYIHKKTCKYDEACDTNDNISMEEPVNEDTSDTDVKVLSNTIFELVKQNN